MPVTEIPTPDGPMAAYVAGEQASPTVIVAHELFGVTDHVRAVCDRLAGRGYRAVAPNFFHRLQAQVDLPADDGGRARGFELLDGLDRERALASARAAIDWAGPGPVGMVGLSVGGHIAYLAAEHLPLAAAAVLYAGWLNGTEIPLSRPEPTLTATGRITGAITVLVGDQDQLVGASDREAIRAAFTASGVDGRLVEYPGTGHGFLCETRAAYNPAAAEAAWGEIERLLDKRLREAA